jgi:xanthine dehydrogenase accessory factor
MVVTRNGISGSIGGGNLEFTASGKARELLAGQAAGHQEQEVYGLGPALNQCCGGAVTLLYEVYGPGVPDWLDALLAAQQSGEPVVLASKVDGAASCKQVITPGTATDDSMPTGVAEAAREMLQTRQGSGTKKRITTVKSQGQTWWLEPPADEERHVMLFGAGHVGQAVARTLSPLPFRVTWIDGREGLFPPGLPVAIETVLSDDPAAEVARAEAGSIFVVMTHSHQLDEDICLQVLQRGDFAWLGLIGSDTKRRRFVHRLEQRGIQAAQLERLVCPIGLSGIRGKQPATIALSLAAQLMTLGDDSD